MFKKILVASVLMAMFLLAAYSWISSVSAKTLSSVEKTQQAATATPLILTSAPSNPPIQAPVATSTSTPLPTPTDIQAPTQLAPTIPPAQVSIPSATQTPVAAVCDRVGFLGDVTIADGTIFNPGDTFTKTWQLQNIGSCAWTSGYTLVFVNGDWMNGSTNIPLQTTVNPGDTLDVSVDLTAPTAAGIYQGNWMLRDANGQIFGTGVAANMPFWVNINVNTPLFAVTHVLSTANPASYTGDCPVTIALDAAVTANGAGTVTYYWQRSDGTRSAAGSLTFTAAGTQTVEDSLAFTAPGANLSGWDQIYIDQPNHQLFDQVAYSLICNSPTATLLPSATQSPTWILPSATPTATATQLVPTAAPTKILPTPTPTQLIPTATATQLAPTATATQLIPTATATQLIPTATPTQH